MEKFFFALQQTIFKPSFNFVNLKSLYIFKNLFGKTLTSLGAEKILLFFGPFFKGILKWLEIKFANSKIVTGSYGFEILKIGTD